MTIATCSSGNCGARIIWTLTERTGKRAPVDAEPNPAGNLILLPSPHGAPTSKVADLLDDPDAPRYMPHFATCPDADKFRNR